MKSSEDWQSERYYNLRQRSVLKSSYRRDGEDKYGPDHCRRCDAQVAKTRSKRRLLHTAIQFVGAFLAAVILYFVFIRQTPYCAPVEIDPAQNSNAQDGGQNAPSYCDY